MTTPLEHARTVFVAQDNLVDNENFYLRVLPNRSGAPRGAAGIIPRGRDGEGGTRPLAVVRCRANYSGDRRALHVRPFLVYGSEIHVIAAV